MQDNEKRLENRLQQFREEFHSRIGKEVRHESTKTVVKALVLLIAAAAVGWWLYLKPYLVQLVGGIPEGGVVAFDSPSGCPAGWVKFEDAASRFIVGVGEGAELKPRTYRERGGEETNLYSLFSLDIHSHSVNPETPSSGICATEDCLLPATGTVKGVEPPNIKRPDSNMPPFLALHFCARR